MALKIIIIGAGCAGPAFAHLLEKTNPKHNITVIERFPTLRTGGQQLDLKAEGIRIARGMGLLKELKAVCVHETGLTVVDKKGASLMRFGVNDSSKQGTNLTNEYEIMRGDIVKVFYDASIAERKRAEEKGEKEGSLTYRFDTTVTHIEQRDKSATVTFSDGQKETYDLVVAADGQNSRTRRMAFGYEVSAKSFRSIGTHAAYFDIPNMHFDDQDARLYFASRSRMILTRGGNSSRTQVYFFLVKEKERHELMKAVHKQSLDEQKESWATVVSNAGWECEKFIEGMRTTGDFYAHELAQIHMPQLHTGRVVLLGDAGYCPTAFTGMGTTLSLIGSYVLAGELAKHGDNVEAALQAYNEHMKSPLDRYRRMPEDIRTTFYPSSDIGIKITNNILWFLSSLLKLDRLLQWMGGMLPESQSQWDMPEYPGLDLNH